MIQLNATARLRTEVLAAQWEPDWLGPIMSCLKAQCDTVTFKESEKDKYGAECVVLEVSEFRIGGTYAKADAKLDSLLKQYGLSISIYGISSARIKVVVLK